MLRRIRRWALWVALGGLVALVVVPMLVRFETTGVLTHREAAGADAEFVDIFGVEIHVERVASEPAAAVGERVPLVVLLHGFGASTFTWRDVSAGLSNFGDVVAYDRPAFGYTQRVDARQVVDAHGLNPYGLEAQIAMIDALLAQFATDDRQVVLIGHSAGGMLAAEYAWRYPDRVDALVLIAPAVLTTGGVPGWLRPLLALPPVDRLGPFIVRLAASRSDALLERSWADPVTLTDEVRAGYTRGFEVRDWERGLWQLVRAPGGANVVDRPGDLSVPALLITGADDRIVATADTIELSRLLPDGELKMIEGTGHLPHEEDPQAVLEAITDWLVDRMN